MSDLIKLKMPSKVSKHNIKKTIISPVKVLVFDIESLPMISYTWGRHKQNIALGHEIKECCMASWSAKWLYDEEMLGDVLTSKEAVEYDDARIVSSLWELINKADVVIAYNGKKFDIPFFNTRCIVNGKKPYSPVQIIDPYVDVRDKFHFSSNKMDNIATALGLENKLSTDFELWRKCTLGDEIALGQMLKYNMQDVVVLEQIFDEMKPWLNAQSLLPMFDDKFVCMACGSDNYEFTGKYYYTPFGKYKLYRCKDCGKYFRSRHNEYRRNGIPFAKIAK